MTEEYSLADKLKKELLAAHLEETFLLYVKENETIPLTLVEVKPLKPPPAGDVWLTTPGVQLRQEPFSMIFRGPMEWALPQQMYLLEHEIMGRFEGLFLVPVGMDGNGRYYEALVN
ncbi:MAG: hypothetical protein GY796_31990 [Chloroflexi bacterium]|nr:hypothetical protein [Chloroflexota bacterium]